MKKTTNNIVICLCLVYFDYYWIKETAITNDEYNAIMNFKLKKDYK